MKAKSAQLKYEQILAGATGFEPAVSALTGPHVEPATPRPRTKASLS